MVDGLVRPLEHGPETLNAVGVYVPVNVLPYGLAHRTILVLSETPVRPGIVGEDLRPGSTCSRTNSCSVSPSVLETTRAATCWSHGP